MIQKPKGTQDVISKAKLYQFLEETFKNVASKFNYNEIRTPIFESKELFQRAVGKEIDIVSKEIYSFLDKSGREFALRPEATASVVRAYIENKLYIPNHSSKFFYIGSMFRYERPQKGRQREFSQLGIENIGFANSFTDIESITLATLFLRRIGIHDYTLKLNTLGSKEEREVYKLELKEFFRDKVIQLCDDCNKRYKTNILRLLDCKVDPLPDDTPVLTNFLGQKSLEEFANVKNILKNLKINFVEDSTLVRGLDYYSHTVFEIEPNNSTTSQSAILGGGRYEHLVKQLGGQDVPGTGFAIGVERLINFIEENDLVPEFEEETSLFIISPESEKIRAFEVSNYVRKKGFIVEFDPTFSDIKKQYKKLELNNSKWAILVEKGQDPKKVTLKNQKTQESTEILLKEIKKIIKGA